MHLYSSIMTITERQLRSSYNMRLFTGLSSIFSGRKTQGDLGKTTLKEAMEEEHKERGAVQDRTGGEDKTDGEEDPLHTREGALQATVETKSSRASCLNPQGTKCTFLLTYKVY